MKLKTLAILLSLAAALPAVASTQPHWAYEGKGSPEHWGEISDEFQTCKTGQYQSPVDIKHVIDGKLPPLGLNFRTDTESIVNNGHTIMVDVQDSDDFMLDNDRFELKQFHFHTPSENLIAGKSYPLEAHFVHANKAGELTVVAVMFEEGAENEALNPLIAAIPAQLNHEVKMEKSIDLAKLFPADEHYYRFSGSLTTPPCTEGVRWLILKQPVTLSAQQLQAFQKALKHTNNRPLQPLHGRVVVE
ncbi:carbonic anhydrase [Pantoea sp. BAV 3049]|uniref:carbonic anhydrase n=1 Tax=Pantoea sp. BAV 3049 TaxID=2654188 RepID=UPI00131C1135|nr:carbonic anhydrase family protein [Pantoea sp. BAV 3049]